jgi:hypothetical protein
VHPNRESRPIVYRSGAVFLSLDGGTLLAILGHGAMLGDALPVISIVANQIDVLRTDDR